jgi:hypothetical protein
VIRTGVTLHATRYSNPEADATVGTSSRVESPIVENATGGPSVLGQGTRIEGRVLAGGSL